MDVVVSKVTKLEVRSTHDAVLSAYEFADGNMHGGYWKWHNSNEFKKDGKIQTCIVQPE